MNKGIFVFQVDTHFVQGSNLPAKVEDLIIDCGLF